MSLTRRDLLRASTAASAGLASAILWSESAWAEDDAIALVEQLTGRKPTISDHIHLVMPADFPTGYTVPMDINVDSPMTEDDHVKRVRVFAPLNPIVEVVGYDFVPGRSIARVSTRIRLAGPQFVVATADMSSGALLMARTWVDVASNGCT